MTRRAYPKFKPSGVENLGDLPDEWEACRLKAVARFQYGGSLSEEARVSGEIDVYGSNGVVGAHDQANTQCPCIIVGRKGSFGKVTYSEAPCFAIDTTYFIDPRFTCNDIRWLYYVLHSLALDSYSKDSAVPGLAREDAYQNPVALPSSLDEQRAIAAFLDRETARIEGLIAKKRRQIELLQEKRAALISHAVTKGLDPKAPMKPSGIEWLGDVPAHWEVKRLKHLASHIVDCIHATPDYVEGSKFPAIRTADVSPGRLDLENARCVNEESFRKQISRLKPRAMDIVYSREGERYGMAALVPESREVCISQRMMLFRGLPREIEATFLMWHLNASSVYRQASQDVIGATSPHVNVETIRNFWIAAPPLCEQREIAHAISYNADHLDRTCGMVSTSIETLREYRVALISAAVTGKIDVRSMVTDA